MGLWLVLIMANIGWLLILYARQYYKPTNSGCSFYDYHCYNKIEKFEIQRFKDQSHMGGKKQSKI